MKFPVPPKGSPCAFCEKADHHFSGDCPVVKDDGARLEIANKKGLCRGCGYKVTETHYYSCCPAMQFNSPNQKQCHHCRQWGLHWHALCPLRPTIMPSIPDPIRGVKRSHLKQQDYSGSKTKYPPHKNLSKSYQGPQFIVQKQNQNIVNKTLEKIVADLNAIKTKAEKHQKDTEKKYAETIRTILKKEFQEFLSTIPPNEPEAEDGTSPMEDDGCTTDGEAEENDKSKP